MKNEWSLLRGRKVRLRAMEPEDTEIIYRWENDPSVWHLGTGLAPVSRFTLEQYLVNAHQDIYTNRQLRLMIDRKQRGQKYVTSGCIDLFDFDPVHMRAGIGILVRNEDRGKGIASEALKVILNYCFDALTLNQVYCHIPEGNTSSLRLFLRNGFRKAGVLREWIRTPDGRKDVYLLQRLAADPSGSFNKTLH
ncbi:MAG: GNAT family N-acetyltransferase [Bacteroidales bacterium]|nr:GNAT family N-acetyltransferase [Bacteroidales bacterium]